MLSTVRSSPADTPSANSAPNVERPGTSWPWLGGLGAVAAGGGAAVAAVPAAAAVEPQQGSSAGEVDSFALAEPGIGRHLASAAGPSSRRVEPGVSAGQAAAGVVGVSFAGSGTTGVGRRLLLSQKLQPLQPRALLRADQPGPPATAAAPGGSSPVPPVMYLYSGHDSTITPLLASEYGQGGTHHAPPC